jgi:hypothetical protein
MSLLSMDDITNSIKHPKMREAFLLACEHIQIAERLWRVPSRVIEEQGIKTAIRDASMKAQHTADVLKLREMWSIDTLERNETLYLTVSMHDFDENFPDKGSAHSTAEQYSQRVLSVITDDLHSDYEKWLTFLRDNGDKLEAIFAPHGESKFNGRSLISDCVNEARWSSNIIEHVLREFGSPEKPETEKPNVISAEAIASEDDSAPEDEASESKGFPAHIPPTLSPCGWMVDTEWNREEVPGEYPFSIGGLTFLSPTSIEYKHREANGSPSAVALVASLLRRSNSGMRPVPESAIKKDLKSNARGGIAVLQTQARKLLADLGCPFTISQKRVRANGEQVFISIRETNL